MRKKALHLNKMENKYQDKINIWLIRLILNFELCEEILNDSDDRKIKKLLKNLGAQKFISKKAYVRELTNMSMTPEIEEKILKEFFEQGPKKDEQVIEEFQNFLNKKLQELEKKDLNPKTILAKNIKQLSDLMNLTRYEEEILEFVILMNQYSILEDTLDLLEYINTNQVKLILSVVLNIPQKEIDEIFKNDSKFSKSSIVYIDGGNDRFSRKVRFISDTFLGNMMDLDEDLYIIIKDLIKSCNESVLTLKDYYHIKRDVKLLVSYLKNAINTQKRGVNILLYGRPGTGKTELVKVLAKELKIKLFEVSYLDEENEAKEGRERLKAYKSAQFLLSPKTLLMYDEAEDIFNSGGFFMPVKQEDKAWINRMLETNVVPTIWITNDIDSVDEALVRRFDMSIEVPIPVESKRKKIIKSYTKDILKKKTIKLLAKNENIAPAIIETALKVVTSTNPKNVDKTFIHLVNNTLKAQGYSRIKMKKIKKEKINYNPKYVNSSVDLEKLVDGIKKTKNARICLYGIPGTGKSAFGKYVAEKLNKKLIIKKGSDLISKWVGETEQNIANAFKEAKDENAVLVFDEVDSFLADRNGAKNSWEVTQVNEMLVQMEEFNGIFIATTNLINNLDKASLRRFDLKLEFKALKPLQAWQMFKEFAMRLSLKVDSSYESKLKNIKNLTPGDFIAVERQSRFRPVKNVEDFLERLENEVKVKNLENNVKLGFIKG